MVRERFEASFERLRDQSNRLAATERSPDNFDEIVEERVELDRLRHEVTRERKKIVSRYEPPATDLVESPRGPSHTQLIGKIAAAVSVALLVLSGALIYSIVRNFNQGFPLEFERVVESFEPDGECVWRVDTTLRNESLEPVIIERVETVLNRRFVRGVLEQELALAPGATGTVSATWNLASYGGCQELDDISHGNLIVYLDSRTSVSRGF